MNVFVWIGNFNLFCVCQSIEWITRKDKQTAIQVIKSDEQNDMQSDTAWMLMKVTIPETKV